MPKELSECNAMTNRKRKKMINGGLKKHTHRKLKIEQHESYAKPGRNSVGDNLSF
jgi:hypothetical protein